MADEDTGRIQTLQPPPVQVKEPPKFDLETYLSNYEGFTRLDRLTHIGLTSLPLQIDALKLAQAEAKASRNLPKYTAISNYLAAHYPSDPSARPDTAWVEHTTALTSSETQRLEHELKGYKNNLIKESIRMAQEELGTHQFNTGQLAEAQRSYSKMREFCTTQAHLAYMQLRMALVAVASANWMNVSICVSRINSAPASPEYAKLLPALSPLQGLAHLATGDFPAAAFQFIATDPAFLAPLEPVAGGIVLNRAVLSPNDLAVYGALTALASLDRPQIQAQVLDSSAPFRQFLELEPHLRRALTAFASGKYTQCLQTLEGYRADWLCDVYLHRHVDALLTLIRRKCIVEYFRPFSAVTIPAMADAFSAPSTVAMQDELVAMIEGGLLDARIDAVVGLLKKPPQSSSRVAVAEKALKAADEQERAMRLRLWRTELLACGMEVKQERAMSRMQGMDGDEAEMELSRGGKALRGFR